MLLLSTPFLHNAKYDSVVLPVILHISHSHAHSHFNMHLHYYTYPHTLIYYNTYVIYTFQITKSLQGRPKTQVKITLQSRPNSKQLGFNELTR